MYKYNVVDRDEIQRQRWKRLEKENIFKRAEIVADYKISKSKSCSTILPTTKQQTKSMTRNSVLLKKFPLKKSKLSEINDINQMIRTRNKVMQNSESMSIIKLPLMKKNQSNHSIRIFDDGESIDYIDVKCRLSMNKSVSNFLNKKMIIRPKIIKKQKIKKLRKVLIGKYFENEF